MSKNNDYTTAGDLLDHEYFSKLILVVNLKQIMEQQCFSSLKNQKKPLLIFHKIETQKIINLLNDSTNEKFKFATKNGIL